jgi:glycosyltransferase involved in cell wall biosynthesis
MPIFNGRKYLFTTIASVLNQNYRKLELICVDDGSTDNSKQIIESFCDNRIKYIYQEHFGSPARGRNVGIKNSVGEYIAFIDQDDILVPESIAERVEFFEKNKDVLCVYSDAFLIDAEDRIMAESFISFKKVIPYSGYCFRQLIKSNFIGGPQTIMIHKTIFNKIGVFDEQLQGTDDYDLFLRITRHYQIGYLNMSLVKWRTHPNSLSKNILLMDINHFKTIKKTFDSLPRCSYLAEKKLLKHRMHTAAIDVAYSYSDTGDKAQIKKWLTTSLKYGFSLKIFIKLILLEFLKKNN